MFTVLALFISMTTFCQSVSKKDAKVFFNQFASVVVKGDVSQVMSFIDKDYIAFQHDGFLEGRTDQFLSELLAGTDKDDNFISPSLKDISSVKTGKIVFSELDGNEVWFKIGLKDGNVIKSRLMFYVSEDGKITIVGAVG